MSLLATLLLAAAPAPSDTVDNEIVVIGRKLDKDWRGTLAKADGQLTCRTTRSRASSGWNSSAANCFTRCG